MSTTQPLDEEGRGSAMPRRWMLALAAALLVIGLVAAIALWWTGHGGSGDYWTEIDARQPVTVDQEALVERLEGTGGRWEVSLRSGPQIERTDWSDQVRLDVAGLSRGRDVISNLADPDSVRRNGRLLILGPAYRTLVDRVLLEDPQVFVDADAEAGRQTYRLGGWLAYYSPAGAEQDRSDDVESYLREVVRCPYDADPCSSGAS